MKAYGNTMYKVWDKICGSTGSTGTPSSTKKSTFSELEKEAEKRIGVMTPACEAKAMCVADETKDDDSSSSSSSDDKKDECCTKMFEGAYMMGMGFSACDFKEVMKA
jgi:hypothetical protein